MQKSVTVLSKKKKSIIKLAGPAVSTLWPNGEAVVLALQALSASVQVSSAAAPAPVKTGPAVAHRQGAGSEARVVGEPEWGARVREGRAEFWAVPGLVPPLQRFPLGPNP